MKSAVGPSPSLRLSAVRQTARREESRVAAAVLGVFMAFAAVAIYRKGFGLTFFYDEWAFIFDRRDWSIGSFLEPHGEHIAVIPAAVYKVLFLAVGLEDYRVYRLIVLLIHLVCVLLVYRLALRRVSPTIAAIAAIAILALGSAWQNLLWPFQIGFLTSIAAGLAALLMLDRRGAHSDLAAMAFVALSLASSSIGIPFAVGVAAEILGSRELRRLWVPAAPLALFLLWYLAYGMGAAIPGTDKRGIELALSNVSIAPGYIADSVASSFGGLLGLGLEWGRTLAVVSVGGFAAWRPRPRPISPRLVLLLVTAATYWGLAGLFRAHLGEATASRYVYLGAVLIVLVALELAGGAVTTPRILAVLGLLVAFAVVANFNQLKAGSSGLQDNSSYVSAELGALELARSTVDPGYRLDPTRSPEIYAGEYFDAVDDLGSPADSPEEIDARPEPVRQAADVTLTHARGVQLAPAGEASRPGSTPTVDQSVNGSVGTTQGCVTFRPAADGAVLDLRVPKEGVFLRSSPTAYAQVRLRAFGRDFPAETVGSLAPRTTARLAVTPVASRPWHLRLSATGVTSDDVLTACGLPTGA